MSQDQTFLIFTSIFILILTSLLYYYRKFFFVPKELSIIPTLPFSEIFRSIFYGVQQDVTQARYAKYANKGIFKYWFLNDWQVSILKYEYAKSFLSESAETLPKTTYPEKHPIRRFMGDGLVFSNGQKWATHRRLANPAFNQALSPEVVGKISTDLMGLLGKLSDQPLDIFKVMQRATIQILGEVAFSHNFKCLENLEDRRDLLEPYEKLLRSISDPLIYFLPWLNKFRRKFNIEFEENLELFNGKLLEIVQNKKDEIMKSKLSNEHSTQKNDLLYGMIEAASQEGYKITSNHLKDEMVTFFLAGHDTTSHSLSVVLYFLAKYPEMQNKAREEAIGVLGAEGKIPTSEDLRKLKYITAIIKESLRAYPPLIITFARIIGKELNYGQMVIPKGTAVNVNLWAIHHDPENWTDPEKFVPERFLSNKGDNNLHTWIPFSSGPRNCVGQNFSLMEQRVIISMLLLNFEVSLPPRSPHKDKLILNKGNLLSPKKLELIFSKRS